MIAEKRGAYVLKPVVYSSDEKEISKNDYLRLFLS